MARPAERRGQTRSRQPLGPQTPPRPGAAASTSATPGHGQPRAELAEIAALKTEVAKLEAERDILKKGRHWRATGPSDTGDAFLARDAT